MVRKRELPLNTMHIVSNYVKSISKVQLNWGRGGSHSALVTLT